MPKAAPVAFLGTTSIAIRPLTMQYRTPTARLKTDTKTAITALFPSTSRKSARATRLMMPEISAGFTLFPLNTTSESHPAPTVPAIANIAEKPMIQLAVSRE